MFYNVSWKEVQEVNKTDTGSWVCGDYILIFREWKRLIDRMTDKNTARKIDRFKKIGGSMVVEVDKA